MDQEFITSRGKVILGSKRLLIQNLKVDIRETIVGQITLPMVVITLTITSFLNEDRAFGYLATAIFTILFFSNHFKQLYIVLFRKSFAHHISLTRIASFELIPDEFGLETEVRLHLKNGRYRSIVFRKLEKQYEPFTELLSQFITHPQLA